MRVEHQLRAFANIIGAYNGKLPLHRFLLSYFKQHRQMGSSDRRWATRYLYSFYRLGETLKSEPAELRLAIGDFLCNNTVSLVQREYLPDLVEHLSEPLQKKLEIIAAKFPAFDALEVFPFNGALSKEIDIDAFCASFFIQPDLFIRADKNSLQEIAKVLEREHIAVQQPEPLTLALPNATKLEQLLPPCISYRVQDLSSQHTATFFKPGRYDKWWDCCAASGGKSILLYEQEPTIEILASDVRESILENLDARFDAAGIKRYQKKVIDLLENNEPILHHYEFDGIILDAPCTGSGTWGRTPEMLTFFNAQRIEFFSGLQRRIATNVVKYLKPGKPLIYITCSVFSAENEETVDYLLKNLPLKLESMEVIKGYNKKADSMFAARLVRI